MSDSIQKVMEHNLATNMVRIRELHDLEKVVSSTLEGYLARNWAFDFYIGKKIQEYSSWLGYSDEGSNYTYRLANLEHLASWVVGVTNCEIQQAVFYINEIVNDGYLKNHLISKESQQRSRARYQQFGCELLGRRIGWYAVARVIKPKLIIETGVDRGLGSCVLTRALMLNESDGHYGRYLGTDINPNAGYLLSNELSNFGKIAIGDSIETLTHLSETIDLFINDSDHSAEYEYNEYATISGKINQKSIILGDNAHATNALFRFANLSGRKFLFFGERPLDHWYPGAGIGAAFV